MKVKKQKKGISLIVLIITIIVMIILAATVIISLSNNGIISKANEAVEKTNEKQYNELATLAWADAYADGKRTQAELLTAVKAKLEENNVDLTKYRLVVTEKGASITYTNGEIQIGDTVAYDCYTGVDSSKLTYTATKSETGKDNDQTFTVTEKDKTRKWQVLGINDGVITLTTDADIPFEWKTGDRDNDIIYNFPFDTVSAIYGYGVGASKARSITVEDINALTKKEATVVKFQENPSDYEYGQNYSYYTYNFNDTLYKELLYGNYIVNTKITAQNYYWLPDTKTWSPEENYGVYYMNIVNNYELTREMLYKKYYNYTSSIFLGEPLTISSFIRPVVELDTNVTLVDTNHDGVWEIQ